MTSSNSDGCAFCGRPWGVAHKSKEHVWPQWMRKHAGELPAQRSVTGVGFALDGDGRYFENIPEYSETRSASILHLVTREVCTSCNNGWMSGLEQQAKPLFLRLAHSAEAGAEVDISPSEAAILARWAQKTVITGELTGRPMNVALGPPWVSRPSMRRQLMDTPRPLRETSLWAARTSEDTGLYTAEVRLAIGDSPRYTPGETLRYSLLTAITFHRLTLLSYIPDTPRQGGGPPLALTTWTRLWPIQHDVSYPPMTLASHEDLKAALLEHHRWLPLSQHLGFRQGGAIAVPR